MSAWGFADEADARRYLRVVLRLWLGWICGMAALLFTRGWWIVVAGVVTIALLLLLARPLQARAAALVPNDTLGGGKFNVVGRGTARDKALQAYAYGSEPLDEATALAGSGRWMLFGRRMLMSVTVAVFIWVILTTLNPPAAS